MTDASTRGATGESALLALFEEHRSRLRALAYRMLGSIADVDDALQETWLRARRADPATIENPGGWLTTVLTRVCLNLLRDRRHRAEESLEAHLPDPVLGPLDDPDPEGEAVLAEQVGFALMVVLDRLAPAERIAFVLHDVFGMPFDQVADALDRTPAAVRQLASRGRKRIREAAPHSDDGPSAQRVVVDAFFAAGRAGDFAALVHVLDPDVVLRADTGGAEPVRVTRGAAAVAAQARFFAGGGAVVPAVVNGAAGAVITRESRPAALFAFTVQGGRIVRIDAISDPMRIARLPLAQYPGDGVADGTPRPGCDVA